MHSFAFVRVLEKSLPSAFSAGTAHNPADRVVLRNFRA